MLISDWSSDVCSSDLKLYPRQYRRSCLSFRKRTKTLWPRMPFFERLWGTIVALLTHRNNKKTAKRAESAICRFDGRQATFASHRRSARWNTAGIKNSPFIDRKSVVDGKNVSVTVRYRCL